MTPTRISRGVLSPQRPYAMTSTGISRGYAPPTPDCPHCNNTPETIPHYLISCPQYARERHVLNTVLRRQAASITYLLTNARATAPLIQFINSTGRLKPTFGDVPPPSR